MNSLLTTSLHDAVKTFTNIEREVTAEIVVVSGKQVLVVLYNYSGTETPSLNIIRYSYQIRVQQNP